MADEFGIDLGNVLGKVEEIRNARIRNRLGETQLADADAAKAARAQAIGGDVQGGLSSLAAIDPTQATQLQTYFSGLDDTQKAAAAANIDQIGRAAAYVLSSDDPELAYQQVRGMITDPKVQQSMPATFDQGWVELQLANASSIDDILKRGAPAERDLTTVAPGSTVIDNATGQPVYTAPPKDAAPTTAATALGKLKADLDAGFIDQPTYDAAVLKQNALPNGQTISVDPATGAMTIQQGGVNGTEMPKLTEGQSKDVNFVVRSTAALETLSTIDNELTNLVARGAEADPTGLAKTWLQSDDFQKAQQAASEFKTAILRKDTGAAVTPQEDALYDRLYIPQPGDKKAVIDQKRDARQRAVDALKAGVPSAAIANLEEQGLLPKVIEAAATAEPAAEAEPAETTGPDFSQPPTKVVNGTEYWNVNGEWFTK